VIANLLQSPHELYRLPVVLQAEHFATLGLGDMFRGVEALILGGTKPTPSALRNWLRTNVAGDVDLAAPIELCEVTPTVGEHQLHAAAERVYWLAKHRDMLGGLHKLVANAYTLPEAGRAWLNRVERDVYGALIYEERELSVADELGALTKRIEERGNGVLDGLPTTLPSLDRLIFGWADYVIVGARPGVGKTAFALEQLRKIAKSGLAAVFFSLEMPRRKLVERMVVQESGLDNEKLKRGDIQGQEWVTYENARRALATLPIEMPDKPGIWLNALRSRVRMARAKFQALHNTRLALIIVDYLQLMGGPEKEREERVATISKGLLAISKEFDLCVMALSQLNRSSVKDGKSRRPTLADLRESGQIEQDATTIILLHAPDPDDVGALTEREVIVAKSRDGRHGSVRVLFNGPQMTMCEEEEEKPPRWDNDFQDGFTGNQPHYTDQ
jgi:replicative DNA helicase